MFLEMSDDRADGQRAGGRALTPALERRSRVDSNANGQLESVSEKTLPCGKPVMMRRVSLLANGKLQQDESGTLPLELGRRRRRRIDLVGGRQDGAGGGAAPL